MTEQIRLLFHLIANFNKTDAPNRTTPHRPVYITALFNEGGYGCTCGYGNAWGLR